MITPLIPVAIVGCQRSGTTLTGQWLGAAPGAALIDEPDRLYPWAEAALAGDRAAEGLFRQVCGKARGKYREPEARFSATGEDAAEPAPGVTHLVLKAPNLTYAYSAMQADASDWRFIYLIRDPRAVVSSMAGLSHIPMVDNQARWIRKYPDIAARYAEELAGMEDEARPMHQRRALVWKVKSDLWTAFADRFPPKTARRIRYEDLVLDQAGARDALAEVSGLDLPQPEDAAAYYQGLGPGRTQRDRPADGASLETWRKHLTEADAAEVLELAGELAAAHDYA
jgi:hypothetical protein